MVYVLIAVIALLVVVDGIYSPTGFSNIRTAYRMLSRTTTPGLSLLDSEVTEATVSAVCPTCKRTTSGIWIPAISDKHEATFLRDASDDS
jgi:hypothetical protein